MAKPMTEKQRKAKTERDRERRNVNKELAIMRDLRALLKVPWNGSVLAAVSDLVDTAAERRQQLAAIEFAVAPGHPEDDADPTLRKVERLVRDYGALLVNCLSKHDAALLRNLNAALEAERQAAKPLLAQLEEITKLVGVYPVTDPVTAVRALLATGAAEHARMVEAEMAQSELEMDVQNLRDRTRDLERALAAARKQRTPDPPHAGGLQFGDIVWFVTGCPPFRVVDPTHHLRSGVVVQVEALDADAKRDPNVLVAFVEDGAGGLTERSADQLYRSRAEAEVAAMKAKTYCAYCGKEYAIDTDATLVSEHIATCAKHPMRAVEEARNAALARVREMETQLHDERIGHDTAVNRLREVEADREQLRDENMRWIIENDRGRKDLERALKPWRVMLIVENPAGPFGFNKFEAAVVDVGQSDRVLMVEAPAALAAVRAEAVKQAFEWLVRDHGGDASDAEAVTARYLAHLAG